MPPKPKLHQPTPADVLALIQGASLPERTVPLCLRGDLQAEWETLHRDLIDAQRAAGEPTLAGPPPEVVDLQGRLHAVAEEMRSAVVTFRVRAIGRPDYNRIIAGFPPRDGHPADNAPGVGHNIEAVQRAMVHQGVVWPEMTPELWDALEPNLTPWQWGQLVDAADALALDPVNVPFSRAASPPPPT